MNEFRFADWNPTRGTVPAYYVDPHNGLITVGETIVINGKPCDRGGFALNDDGKTETLVGWAHKICQSYENGRVLIPLKGSRA